MSAVDVIGWGYTIIVMGFTLWLMWDIVRMQLEDRREKKAAAPKPVPAPKPVVDDDVPPMTHQGLKDWIEQKQWEIITGHRVEKEESK